MTSNLTLNKKTSVSVKNTKGLFQTRLKSDNLIILFVILLIHLIVIKK